MNGERARVYSSGRKRVTTIIGYKIIDSKNIDSGWWITSSDAAPCPKSSRNNELNFFRSVNFFFTRSLRYLPYRLKIVQKKSRPAPPLKRRDVIQYYFTFVFFFPAVFVRVRSSHAEIRTSAERTNWRPAVSNGARADDITRTRFRCALRTFANGFENTEKPDWTSSWRTIRVYYQFMRKHTNGMFERRKRFSGHYCTRVGAFSPIPTGRRKFILHAIQFVSTSRCCRFARTCVAVFAIRNRRKEVGKQNETLNLQRYCARSVTTSYRGLGIDIRSIDWNRNLTGTLVFDFHEYLNRIRCLIRSLFSVLYEKKRWTPKQGSEPKSKTSVSEHF